MATSTPRSSSRPSSASFVRVPSKSPSCVGGTSISYPSPIRIRGLSTAMLDGTACAARAGAPKATPPARGATTTEELVSSDLRRPRPMSTCPSSAAAPTFCYRAASRPGRRLPSPTRTVSRVPGLGSVPELCEFPGNLEDDPASWPPVASTRTSKTRQERVSSLHKLDRKPSTTDASALMRSDSGLSKHSSKSIKTLRFEGD